MVETVTNLGRNGLSDWIIQRLSALILAIYTVFILTYLAFNPELTYSQWHGLFSFTAMRIFSLLAMLALASHVWIGLWSVSTDYIKPLALRLSFQIIVILALFVYTIWGIQVLWGF